MRVIFKVAGFLSLVGLLAGAFIVAYSLIWLFIKGLEVLSHGL